MSEIFEQGSLDELERSVDQEVDDMIDQYSSSRIPNEQEFSTLLADRIARAANKLVLDIRPNLGFRSSASSEMTLNAASFSFAGRTLNHAGAGSEEREFGADILLMLESNDSLVVTKGLLAQAKAQKRNFAFTADQELYEQCGRMYAVTQTSSFAFIYAANGLHVFENPYATRNPTLRKKDSFKIGALVSDFVGCKRGDPAITEFAVGPFAEVATALRDKDYEALGELMDVHAAVKFDVEPL
ncbi:hypothetical protein G6M16_021265 [Agrobacterium tumefaciens]|nr:hypothetical protein G6M16_021265 [Agrobacterium tumefaciens]